MNPVQLVVLQGVDVGDVVASCQFVVFGVYTLTTLVGVGGVACIEKGVAYAVVAAQGVAYVPQCGQFQFLGIAVVGKVVLHAACGFQGFVESVVHVLEAVAGACGCQYAECLAADADVFAETEVAAEVRQGGFLLYGK